jgi:DUF4097 and DUF4098 domain-containing protein YvlB
MSERVETFQIAGTPRVAVRLPTGDTRVVSGEPGTLVVRLSGSERDVARFIVEQRGDTIVVEPERTGVLGRWASVRLVVEAGVPPELSLRSATGSLSATVPLAGLTADTATGEVDAVEVRGDAAVKSASGAVRIGAVTGRLEVVAAAGDVEVGAVGGELTVKSASGDVTARDVAGDATVKAASGDVDIGVFRGGDLDVKTLSGDVAVGVTSGRRFRVSLQTVSGNVRSAFPVSGDAGAAATARLSVSSMSGDVVIRSAG